MTGRRVAAAVVTSLVAAAALTAHPAAAAGGDSPVSPGCGSGVTVVVDPDELGGDPAVACAPEPGTAVELFADVGFRIEFQPQLQDFVCRVDGRPTDRPCTDGDSYWSLWWAEPSGDWVYATLGVGSLEVPVGGYLGFAWHQGDGEAAPPDVAVGGPDDADGPRATGGDPSDEGAAPADDAGGLPIWAAGVLAALVLGAAAVVVVRRRRT